MTRAASTGGGTAPRLRARNEDLVVGRWGARFLGRRFAVSVGRAGFRDAKREGDGASPRGRYRLLRAFWRADRMRAPRFGAPRPAASDPRRPIGPRMGWCDDPSRPEYNRLVGLRPSLSAERMRRADRLYDLVVETDHNSARAPGEGSAIFVHVWRGPGRRTAGCVAFRRADLLWILRRWRPRSRLVLTGDAHEAGPGR